jgi:hypothetical protein
MVDHREGRLVGRNLTSGALKQLIDLVPLARRRRLGARRWRAGRLGVRPAGERRRRRGRRSLAGRYERAPRVLESLCCLADDLAERVEHPVRHAAGREQPPAPSRGSKRPPSPCGHSRRRGSEPRHQLAAFSPARSRSRGSCAGQSPDCPPSARSSSSTVRSARLISAWFGRRALPADAKRRRGLSLQRTNCRYAATQLVAIVS